MIWMYAIPFFVADLYFLLGCILYKPDKSEKKDTVSAPAVRKLAAVFIPCGIQMALFTLIWLVRTYLMAGMDFIIPHASYTVFCIATTGAVFSHLWLKSEKPRRLIRIVGLLSLILLVLEIVFFNGNSLTLHKQSQVITAPSLVIDDEGHSVRNGEVITVRSDSAVVAENLPAWTRCVTLQLKQAPEQAQFRIKLLICDNNFTTNPQVCGHKYTSTYGRDVQFSVIPYEKLRSVRTEYFEIPSTAELYSMTCFSAVPYHFCELRYLLLLGLISLILFIRIYDLGGVVYDHKKDTHRIVAGVMTILCVISVFIFWVPDQKLIEYSDEFDASSAKSDPYIQTFDAFQRGQVWLNLEVDPRLLELENVFDRPNRDKSEIPYAFDRALYNGKYYSYFGLAPVLTFYYPVYWLTGKLPTLEMSCMFYAPFTILLLCLAIICAVRLCCKSPNFILMLLMMPCATMLCGVYYCLQFTNQYDVVVASGLCFLSLSLWSGMQACLCEKKWQRYVLFAICGIGVILSVQSRPTMAITSVILAPFFLGILLDKKAPFNYRIVQAAAFVVPLLIGAAGTFWYNAIRFGSPLDFGAGYQLTISNIQANHIRLSAIPATVYHYFLQAPTARPYFPYFTLSYLALDNYQMYNNLEHTLGALSFPVLLLTVILIPKTIRSRNGIGAAAAALQCKSMVICAAVMTFLVAWVDFCLGGVSLRYLYDFMPILLIASSVILLTCVRDKNRYLYPIAVGSIVLSMGMMLLLLPQVFTEGNKLTTLAITQPAIRDALEEALHFWG